jgi:hypothetical protein
MKSITVNELIRQLKVIQELVLGENEITFIDEDDIEWWLEEGIHDNYENRIVLG